MSGFFIHRPILAIVISLMAVIIGSVSLAFLPISLFPNITPPEIVVSATDPGSDAVTVEQSVATPIEQQISGVDNMNYMYSLNANSGQMKLRVNFDESTNPKTDQVLTQMRQAQAAAQLPPEVLAQGVSVQKSFAAPLMLVALRSADGRYDSAFLTNYAIIKLNDELTRVPGISNVQVFGSGPYAIRIWVKPDQLARFNLTVPDVVNAVQQQNAVNPVGLAGGEPVPSGQEFSYMAVAQGQLATPEQFDEIVIREQSDGGTVRLRDVARVELGSQVYTTKARLNGQPSAIIALYQLPGTNALVAADGVKRLMTKLSQRFPQGLEYVISLDTTQPVRAGIWEMIKTLIEALALVILVVYLFLQSWRATLIPLLAVPVSLLGTFMLFPLLGFSINTLSLFGLVLAIGLVVDDAIVVVEAVERHLQEGLEAKEATLRAMKEITGPVIGVALVLASVFVPTAFVPGITGRLYQQFALTIAVSVSISAFNALTLSPALCALLLRRREANKGLLGKFFGRFNYLFGRATESYLWISKKFIRRSGMTLVLLLLFGLLAVVFGKNIPTSFLPDEDQGFFYVNLQLPNASSLQRTDAVCRKIESALSQTVGVRYTTTVAGFSLLSGVQSTYGAFLFVTLDPWEQRKKLAQNYQVLKGKLNLNLMQLPEGSAFAFSPPAIPGLGVAGGVSFVLEDRADRGVQYLANNVDTFLTAARDRPELGRVTTTLLPNVPQMYIEVDRDQALKQGVTLNDVYNTLQTFLGGSFINYFNRFGRQWQVYIQADETFRSNANQIGQFYIRNANNQPVPLSSVTRIQRKFGPEFTMRYNLYRAAQIQVLPAPGYSSGQAMHALEEVFARTMPREMGYDYLGMSFQEKKAQQGISPVAIFGLSLLFVFLILAALYESWSLPFSVLLSTPVAVFGTLGALYLRRSAASALFPPVLVQIENNVFAQIGLVMIIGLVAKNAILIVEFAKVEYENGATIADAALAGARLRFRPILMTSLAFIAGCIPLALASGSGALARRVLGTGVIGGMLAASGIAIFLIPAGFCIVERATAALRHLRQRKRN
ncbi:MAG: hydrophobic/amphiphilic exporter (mainly bacteria), family [Verrucomicrobiota bacterium]|jgi:hydrophobic/amphiphilic exporter-1 (mainly G- bacteria), HAE1 family|nr:hydrophobic/amphiphilic exporter (mainly bacteria), family [Verrucomicrobiota bacterium]